MAKKIESQCEANGGKVALQTLLLEIVNEGRIFNKITEAKFISKHSSLYQFSPEMKIIIRPVINSDKSRLVNCILYYINIIALPKISPTSLFLRFMHPIKRFSPEQLEYLSHLDYVNHFAFCVLSFDPSNPLSTTNGIAVGRYIREYDDPELAEWAVTVIDEYQGHGIGSSLLYGLSLVALQNGIKKFGAVVHPTNAKILNGLKKLNAVKTVRHGSAYYIFDLPVPESFVKYDQLRECFKSAANGDGKHDMLDIILKEFENDAKFTDDILLDVDYANL